MKATSHGFRRLGSAVALGLILVFAPPQSVSGDEAAPPAGPRQQPTLLKTIIVADYYPYTFLDADGVPAGFSVDLLKAVATVMGMELDIRPGTWKQAREDLASGDIDLLPMMAYSVERDRYFDFSPAHTIAYDAFFTRRDGERIRGDGDLKGKTVIVMRGDQADDYLRSSGLVDPGHLILTDSLPEALRRLSSGEGDAALMPKLVGLALLHDLGLTNLALTPAVVESYERPFSFAVKEGNLPLLERLSQGLSIVKNTGQYRTIYDRWFAALEPKGTTLGHVVRRFLWLLAILLLIGSALMIWSLSLKRQVNARTRRLQEEIDERRIAEGRFRQVTETIREVFWLGDLDWKNLYYVNPAYEQVWGRPSAELYARPTAWLDSVLGEDRPKVEAAVAGAVAAGTGEVAIPDFRIARPDGSMAWIAVRAFPVLDPSGRLSRIAGIAEEVTERKSAEEKLRKLNRELQAVGNCHQALLRAVDEESLLNEVCRIVCDEAGYRMAWVGYAEQDDDKSIRPVAWAGFESGYIAAAKLSWGEHAERGRGPAGEAIRGGRVVYVQDFVADERMAHWRQNALQRGYRSGIALPLKDDDSVAFGVLLIYASEPNAITPDEIRLMDELASDLAFGILALRSRTERDRAERALEASEAKTRSILDNVEIGVSLISPDMEILELNRRMREWFPAVDPALHPICYRAFNDPPRQARCDYCPTSRTLQDGLVHETTTETPGGGAVRNFRVVSSPILSATGDIVAVVEIVEDMTEKLALESQLRQAQKMESVGRLAGGVAHDFNNMLGVILGHTELVLKRLTPEHQAFSSLEEIRKAAQRSADLTKQLLAFARKQTVAPRVLDLNEAVAGMLDMLRRLIGEDIELVWLPGTDVSSVKVDPSQIDQILANLCVNAHDAIDGAGKIVIGTDTAIFDEVYCAGHVGSVPGEYALLTVSDDGCGMDETTLDRAFEPFFTTKGVGEGTGLGLSTVYGIVKQNNGFITVNSELERGTTFRIYLPRHDVRVEKPPKVSPSAPIIGGQGTILFVEDEPLLLDLGKLMLDRLGYHVLAASAPDDAIRLAREHAGEIQMLMSDVIMPGMDGRELARRVTALVPGIKLLFTSGYAGNIIAHHGILEESVSFIQKPYSMEALAAKVREVLEDR